MNVLERSSGDSHVQSTVALSPQATAQRRGLITDISVRKQVIALGVLLLLSVTLRLLTWDIVADGEYARYVRAVAFGAASTVAVWGLILVQVGYKSRLPLLAAGVVLFGGDAVHYARLAHPAMRGGSIQSLNSTFTDEATTRSQWDIETSGGGSVTHERGALVLSSPANGTASVRAKMGAVPDPKTFWWLPVGIGDKARQERVTWRASIQRTGEYYVVANIKQLLIQVVSYGVHITYPDDRKQLRGHEVQHPVGSDGKVHEWQITRGSQAVSLSIEGKQIWSAPVQEPLQPVQFGESKADPSHGGTMRLEMADVRSFLARS